MQCNALSLYGCISANISNLCLVFGCSSVVVYIHSEIEQASVLFRDSCIDNFIDYDEFTFDAT